MTSTYFVGFDTGSILSVRATVLVVARPRRGVRERCSERCRDPRRSPFCGGATSGPLRGTEHAAEQPQTFAVIARPDAVIRLRQGYWLWISV